MEKKVIAEGRIQSPSSIKTYKQCPRKYYYQYIENIPTSANIHTVRGNIAHSALEHFFDIDTSVIDLDTYESHLKIVIQRLLVQEWKNYKKELDNLDLAKEDEMRYFEETMMMLLNWIEQFCHKISHLKGSFQERFAILTPLREQLYISEEHRVRGYIDAIENRDGTVRLMDYKTSKRENLNEHILQLAIYSLLYNEKHGHLPDHVGVYFLKGKEQVMDVDEELIALAKRELEQIHERTRSKDVVEYPKQVSSLCKYSTGQCDFYEVCKPHE